MEGSWEVCLFVIGKFSFPVYMICLTGLDPWINGIVGVSAQLGVSFLDRERTVLGLSRYTGKDDWLHF